MSALRKVRWRTVKREAKNCLEFGAEYGYPVDVKKIAEVFFDITVREMVFSDASVSGAIGYKDNKVTIAVNKKHSEERQRFTMAHELGHYCLHPEAMVVDRALYRNTVSSEAVSVKEIEANGFAAELLMPEHDVREKVREFNALCEDEIRELCKRYGVSTMAMTVRLTSLGLMM
ncbi:MAG TPA: ImmA/IrrE family metallo-endopeptidase [Phycisphaerales bacterium]|nr:ImmA/IrrE family metallo-endopeptidase [Phycisphaerales bacterium]